MCVCAWWHFHAWKFYYFFFFIMHFYSHSLKKLCDSSSSNYLPNSLSFLYLHVVFHIKMYRMFPFSLCDISLECKLISQIWYKWDLVPATRLKKGWWCPYVLLVLWVDMEETQAIVLQRYIIWIKTPNIGAPEQWVYTTRCYLLALPIVWL